MKRLYFFLILLSLILGGYNGAWASHIVGGEVKYSCIGGNQYRIELNIYQDCLTGSPDAIAQDDPAHIAIFDGNGNFIRKDSIYLCPTCTQLVPPNFNNSCVNNPPATCLRKASFIKNYMLPPNATGYYFVYQRCCRNANITNVINPSTQGATFYCVIPPAGGTPCPNNSAVFNNYPPQIICINNPLVYDHSASDGDGDSLSYEFCEALRGASDRDPLAYPTSINFISLPYRNPPYSAQQPMLGSPLIQINPTTGIITGTPNQIGRFVVTVCCHEWRNGVMINTVRRDFQFVVTPCSKAVVANIPQYSEEFNTYLVQCNSNTIHFNNLSTGGFKYHWDFGVPGTDADTSNQFEPDYTYATDGIYTVTLVVNRGTTCPDSITRLVKVYPTMNTDFSVNGLPCPNSPLQFTDLTTSTYKPINRWTWSFGDQAVSGDQNPTHSYSQGGKYTVRLISQNIKGCIDTAVKELDIENFHPYAGNDTIIVKGESINFQASGGLFYTWTPATYLNNPDISNPTGYYPDSTHVAYNVHIKSEVGCEGDDSIKVWVVNQGALFVPSGFTPNNDGLNDFLKVVSIGYRKINYFRIFNRWGQQMFYTVYINEGWDGVFNGKPADIGTYFWELSVDNRFGKEEKYKGDATLIR